MQEDRHAVALLYSEIGPGCPSILESPFDILTLTMEYVRRMFLRVCLDLFSFHSTHDSKITYVRNTK